MKQVQTIDVYGNKYDVPAESLKPLIHVYGIAIDGDKALIVPEYDGYDWPGGTFKPGEDTIETLKREVKEETGYEVEPIKLLGLYTSFFHHIKRKTDHHSLLIYYLVKVTGGEISSDGFDEDEKEYAKTAKWVPISDLHHMRLARSLDIADELISLATE